MAARPTRTDPSFSSTALVGIIKLTGEFTMPQMAEQLEALGVPGPNTDHPLRAWSRVAVEAVKLGLLVKTDRFVMVRTERQQGSTERMYLYARTDKTTVRMPPARIAEAEKILAAHVPPP